MTSDLAKAISKVVIHATVIACSAPTSSSTTAARSKWSTWNYLDITPARPAGLGVQHATTVGLTPKSAMGGVEIRERLVEQEDARVSDDRPADHDTLTLAA